MMRKRTYWGRYALTNLEECVKRGYSYCEGEGMGEQELIRIYDKMKIGGMIKDFRFTYLGRNIYNDYIDIYELLHIRRNNDVVDVYSVIIRYKDGDIVGVRMEKLFSI